ncbi:hypothetical protein FF38_01499 [Lucilia cuprina]|uniref:Uncharacterized protein n=1 Tax=Lucilia cuprina TaxID=7375 RepID=A0A0L0BSV9_LUCCU|nr:hypothetical protein FF38_01499 [Lucilia cuprina]
MKFFEGFHFCQAIRRNICKRKSLLNYIRSSRNASLLYHKIMALPLLPANLIRSAFEEIKRNILIMDSEGFFVEFLKYFETQWLDKVGCNILVFAMRKLGRHRQLKHIMASWGGSQKKMSFFKFVPLIRNEEFFKSRHFAMKCESESSDEDSDNEELNLPISNNENECVCALLP